MKQSRNALPEGYRLQWYLIREVLGQGGFGITYLAEDTNLSRQVAIKEYLPVEIAVRGTDATVHPLSTEHGEQFQWGLDRFIKEAQTLARFKHANIVHVFTVFRENNTAYMVMEYEHGRGLDQLLSERKTLPEPELWKLLAPLLDGLEQIHALGFIHRDIKPANIYIRTDNSAVLLDFGSARQSFGQHTRTLTAMVSPGFAPFEQYTGKGEKQGPWTDIYGLGATLYRAIIGRSPANAMDRSDAILQTSRDVYVGVSEIRPPGYTGSLLAAIDRALAFRPEDRPQSIALWRAMLRGDIPATTAAPDISISPARSNAAEAATVRLDIVEPAATAGKPSLRRLKPVAAAVTIVLLAMIAVYLAPRRDEQNALVSTTVPATTPPTAIEATTDTGPSAEADTNGIPEQTDSDLLTTEPGPETVVSNTTPQTVQQEPDRNRFDLLRRRLQQNPGDMAASQSLRELLIRYEDRVRQSIRERNYAQAEDYLEEMLRLAPSNQKLRTALQQVRAQKQSR